MISTLLSAFIIGLVSAGHCFGMCGGLVVAAGFNSQNPAYIWLYNLGRISTYMVLGALFGLTTASLPASSLPWLKVISITLLILTALYFMGITSAVTRLEKIGLPIWRFIQPYTRRFLPVSSNSSALAIGLLWGFIPCGLVYTAVAFAISLGSTHQAILAMAAFGAGTLPAMLFSGLAAHKIRPFLAMRRVRIALGCVLLITAVVLAHSILNH